MENLEQNADVSKRCKTNSSNNNSSNNNNNTNSNNSSSNNNSGSSSNNNNTNSNNNNNTNSSNNNSNNNTNSSNNNTNNTNNTNSSCSTTNNSNNNNNNNSNDIDNNNTNDNNISAYDNNNNANAVRLLQIQRSGNDACGFHLTRSKWDPYPWVSAVDAATPAELSGVKAGDCVLEVNGKDVLGLRIKDIAELVREKSENVTLLLWSSGVYAECDPESLCCGPLPQCLQRLSLIVQNILSLIECPVCLSTISPPAMQCQNGHLLCLSCRIRAERCPVCRDRYTPRRARIAEQIYAAISSSCRADSICDAMRQKGSSANRSTVATDAKTNVDLLKPTTTNVRTASPQIPTKHKLLAKLLGKSCSMENLRSTIDTNDNGAKPITLAATSSSSLLATTITTATEMQSATNQLLNTKKVSHQLVSATRNPTTTTTTTTTISSTTNGAAAITTTTTTLTTTTTSTATATTATSLQNSLTATRITSTSPRAISAPTISTAASNAFQANSMFKHFSLSTNDLSRNGAENAIECCRRCKRQLSSSNNNNNNNSNTSTNDSNIMGVDLFGKSASPFLPDKQKNRSSLNSSSLECCCRHKAAELHVKSDPLSVTGLRKPSTASSSLSSSYTFTSASSSPSFFTSSSTSSSSSSSPPSSSSSSSSPSSSSSTSSPSSSSFSSSPSSTFMSVAYDRTSLKRATTFTPSSTLSST